MGPDIELILYSVLTPLIILGKRNLQSLALMLPLRHEGTTTILSHKLVFANSLGLSLELIVLTERTNVQLRTIRQTGSTKLAQSKNVIRSEMM
jgi:hypothetical protein